jgi:DNA-binding IscR family transcriptional regulator
MRLTRGSDYGLRGMLYMARQPVGASMLGASRRRRNLPESYLANPDLARNKLLLSHRGAGAAPMATRKTSLCKLSRRGGSDCHCALARCARVASASQ